MLPEDRRDDQHGPVEYIRIGHRVYGKGIREIARETGHDRKTIRKVLRGEPSGYGRRQSQPYPVLGAYLRLIDSWLEGNKDAPRKQCHTAIRVYHRLVNEAGFAGGATTVRQYVRQAKIRLGLSGAQAFIPLEPDCGPPRWVRCRPLPALILNRAHQVSVSIQFWRDGKPF